jgi:hypothetical protein
MYDLDLYNNIAAQERFPPIRNLSSDDEADAHHNEGNDNVIQEL